MSNSLNNLLEILKTVRAQPLFVMRLDVKPIQIVGSTPGTFRRIGVVPGGTFEGTRLSGTILEGEATGSRYVATGQRHWMSDWFLRQMMTP